MVFWDFFISLYFPLFFLSISPNYHPMLLKKEGSETENCFLGGCVGMWLPLISLPSVSNSNSSGPVLWAQKLHCHEGEGEKEASQAEDIACRSFCVSPRVPGFCLCFTPAVLGLSPGAGGQGAAVEKRICELEATADCWQRPVGVRRLVVPSACDPGEEPRARPSASKVPCWG